MAKREQIKEWTRRYKEYVDTFSILKTELPLFKKIFDVLPFEEETEDKKILEELEESGYRKIELLKEITERNCKKLRTPILRYFRNDETMVNVLGLYVELYSGLERRIWKALENLCNASGGKLYTTSEAAEYLGISTKRVRKLLQPVMMDGEPLRKGREYIYRSGDVEKLREMLKKD